MAVVTTSTVTADLQKVFNPQLLDYALQELRLADFAMKAKLPQNKGGKIISFLRFDVPVSTNVQSLTEGTAISTFRDLTLSNVDVTLAEFGQAVRISDIRTKVELFDTTKQAIKIMGEEAALHFDTQVRNTIVAGSPVERYAQGIADFATLDAATASAGSSTTSDFKGCYTRLSKNRAKLFKGGKGAVPDAYVAVVPPETIHTLRDDPRWLEANKYGNPDVLFSNEIGYLDGIRYVNATNQFIELHTKGTYDSTGGIHSNLVFGENSYGVPELTGMSEMSPTIIVVDTPDSGNPLGQYKTIGWKAFWASLVLNATWIVNLRSKTTFV